MSSDLALAFVPIADIKPNPRNTRKHPARQIAQLAANIQKLGFTCPVLINKNNQLIAGHARRLAGLRLGMSHLPALGCCI